MWHPNGQVWSTARAKYARTIDKEFDSSGFLVRQTIQTKGSSLTCIETLDSAASDSAIYEDGSCVCSWGKVYWRDGIWIDEKGRDLNSNYTYISTEYYTDGSVWKETIWNMELKKFLVKEWNEKGVLISETTL